MRVVQLPVYVFIQRGGVILILFPGFVSLMHDINQLRIIFSILIEPDAKFSVDLIDMQSVGILQIKEGVHQPSVCSVVNGRNGVGIPWKIAAICRIRSSLGVRLPDSYWAIRTSADRSGKPSAIPSSFCVIPRFIRTRLIRSPIVI